MRTTIDQAGRLVIPKALRDELGLRPGEVEVTAEGTGLRIQPVAGEDLGEEGGRLVVPTAGAQLDDETVQTLLDAGRR